MAALDRIFLRNWRKVRSQSLYLNSIYLVSSTAVLAILGFLYWLIAARLYTSSQVGIASTLVSVMTYVGLASQLGINVGIIRYLPNARNRTERINTGLSIVILPSILLAIIAIIGLSAFVDDLSFMQHDALVLISFVFFMIFGALNVTIESVLIALRKSVYVLVKNVILSLLKIVLVVMFTVIGAYGLFSSWGLAILFTVLFSFFLLRHSVHYRFQFQILKSEVHEMAGYSAGNYLAGLISNLPIYLLPPILTILLGASTTAHYYIAMSFAALLFSIPISICNALFAEGATDEEHILAHTYRAVGLVAIILIPATVFLTIFGKWGLQLFGSEYSEKSVELLSILSLSSIFVAINTFCWTLLNLRGKVTQIIFTMSINAGLVITLSLLLIQYGLVGVGIAWTASQALTSLVYIIIYRHYKFVSSG